MMVIDMPTPTGDDSVWGRSGRDAGTDALFADDGWDSLDGRAGADTLDGGLGDDRLAGGTDADTSLAA